MNMAETVNHSSSRYAYRFLKRLFDILASTLAMLIASPVLLVIAVLVKLSSTGPVFYKHYRVGFKGKPMYIYKFRTMVKDADKMIASFTPEQKAEFYRNFKLEDDPRITKVGSFLRRTSLDELPQLLNIFKGEMSFVGPRPIVDEELERYGNDKEKFLSVKPGLTGYWACHGRSDTSYAERMRLELYYVDHASLMLDIRILLKTVLSVFKQEGAK